MLTRSVTIKVKWQWEVHPLDSSVTYAVTVFPHKCFFTTSQNMYTKNSLLYCSIIILHQEHYLTLLTYVILLQIKSFCLWIHTYRSDKHISFNHSNVTIRTCSPPTHLQPALCSLTREKSPLNHAANSQPSRSGNQESAESQGRGETDN